MTRLLLLALPVVVAACATNDSRPEQSAGATQDQFWTQLSSLCGKAYAGQVIDGSPADTAFAGKPLVMHARQCGERDIRIAFHVGDNRSRTWILSRTDSGLRLKHDHRHRDGLEDSVTQYGGDTRTGGSAGRQEFHADAHTAALIPAAATNVWTVEVRADSLFAYALRREGTDRRFRAEFDLTRTVDPPPAPWGYE